MRNGHRDPGYVQSVDRALVILEMLAARPPEPTVAEIARRLGVHKATASRLLATLAVHGLVERDPRTDRYRLGFGLVRLTSAVLSGLDLVQQARPVLQRLADQTAETVNLGVLDGDQVVNIDQVSGTRAVVSVNWVGQRHALHCTSNGKVLLAAMPAEARERILAGPLDRPTSHTIVDPAELRRHLGEASDRGFASTFGELEEGLSAVAAPIRGPGGAVIAALSVAGPSYRLTEDRIADVAALTRRAAAEISRRMGHLEGRPDRADA